MLVSAWIKETGGSLQVEVDDLHPLEETLTLKECPGQFHTWNGEDWQFNRDRWLAEFIRPERNRRLDAADQRVRRYDYQVRIGNAPSENEETITRVLQYMQELRDIPATAVYDNFSWPEIPS